MSEPIGTKMVFWKRPIELPENFYRAAGECFFYSLRLEVMRQKLEASSMTFAEAFDLLDLTTQACVRFKALIAQYPIKTVPWVELREASIESTSQSCEEKINLISSSGFELSLPIQHAANFGVLFERGVIGEATNFGVDQKMAVTQMAKGANISSDEFIRLAVQAFKNTPEGKCSLAQAFPQGMVVLT